jgi:hypothetical protein
MREPGAAIAFVDDATHVAGQPFSDASACRRRRAGDGDLLVTGHFRA